VATLLARGKLASLQDDFDRTGFKDFDQDDEGTFDKEGHPEIRWKVLALKPRVELGPEVILGILTGAKGDDAGMSEMLSQLMGQKVAGAQGQDGGPTTALAGFPGGAVMAGALQAQLTQVSEQIKKGLREVHLTVSWKDGEKEESFTVVTHLLAFAKGTA
jgi:general secretion pathway protein I